MKITTKNLVFAATVAAVYATLTLLLEPISYGPVQSGWPSYSSSRHFTSSVLGLFIDV